MSYRSLKRLLGETSLERKCRLLLGGVILVLILVSFFLYGFQTEKLVWDQTKLTGQLLVSPFLLRKHHMVGAEMKSSANPISNEEIEKLLPDEDKQYTARLLRPPTKDDKPPAPEYTNRTLWEFDALKRILANERDEVSLVDSKKRLFQYVKAVRLTRSCMECHATANDKRLGYDNLKEGDLIGAVSLEIRTDDIELAVNLNRAILLSFAIATAITAMFFAYLTVRYVIVKPVAHLTEVAEEIASGNLDIRANIQTGDEFQELSLVFNRMLRSLVSMQDELRRLNSVLDNKLDELAQANMALFEMNRLKSEFLATISHELRTPLNSVLGFSDLVAEVDSLQPKQKRWVQNIQSSGKLLLTMINDILDLAKLEAGKMQIQLEEFSLRDLVEGQIQMTRPLADKKNIDLAADVDAAIPILKQDSGKIAQILSNLLSNAIKFTPEGGRIVVACKPDRAHVVISVTDNGVGIAPEDQKLIFEKFRQAGSGLTRDHGGTGLGLSIVRELTKLLGGDEVQLESELGRGSTFTVRLPMQLSEPAGAELTLGEGASIDFSKYRNQDVRFFSSSERTVKAEGA